MKFLLESVKTNLNLIPSIYINLRKPFKTFYQVKSNLPQTTIDKKRNSNMMNNIKFFEKNIFEKFEFNEEKYKKNNNIHYSILDAIIPNKLYANNWELYDFQFDWENSFGSKLEITSKIKNEDTENEKYFLFQKGLYKNLRLEETKLISPKKM